MLNLLYFSFIHFTFPSIFFQGDFQTEKGNTSEVTMEMTTKSSKQAFKLAFHCFK